MPTKIGHFEIFGDLAKSSTGGVFKANDSQTGQMVALKAIDLTAFADSAAQLEQSLLEEVERVKVLSSSNITSIFGAGEMDGKFCAAMEYIQGNSISTMLTRKEGFSIWDLLDIGRQVCGGLDHAHSMQVFHFNLEPDKIMCGWDGTVKILGFGISSVGKFAHKMPAGVPVFLAYMSPEQVLGENVDARSNLFTLGAILYEMVTERRAFEGNDGETLRQSIVEGTPLAPIEINPKLHPGLSDLIMKALAKNPAHRFQKGRELLDALEQCKDTKPKVETKAPAATKAAAMPESIKAAAQSKFIASTPAKPGAPVHSPAQSTPAASASGTPKKNAAAAAAGRSTNLSTAISQVQPSKPVAKPAKPTGGPERPSASMSSAAVNEPEIETFADSANVSVDPLMAEGGPQDAVGKFSEINELPPLKEVYIAPETSAPPAPEPFTPRATMYEQPREKPKVQPREAAKKAIKEIQGVPPRLVLYSIAGAVVLILAIVVGFWMHIHSLNRDDDAASRPAPAAEAPSQAAPAQQPAPSPVVSTPEVPTPAASTQEQSEPAAETTPASAGRRSSRRKAAPAAAAVLYGQMFVDSTPQGAHIQLDGATDPSWITPVTIPGVQAGQHSVTVTKTGYSADARTINVASGSKSSVVVHLSQLMATLSVKSDPPGANIYIDTRDTGKTTPAQVSVDKGQHVIVARKMGYIDQTTSAQFNSGQTVTWSPTLLPLGNVDNIRTVGKMKKLFGGNGGQGQVAVSIRTQPKGAQVAINQHMLDKPSPVEVMLDPGNYVVDITQSGYAPIHKVITVEKGNKIVIDDAMQPQ